MNRRIRFKLVSLIIPCIFVLVFGCRPTLDDLTVWKGELRSPDGSWIASARTIQNGGFGSADIETIVYLNQNIASRPQTEVLGFDCRGPVPRPYVLDNVANAGGTINLTMKWVTPSHLDVTYNGDAGTLDFQVVKLAGIDISVQDFSREPTKSKDSK